MAIPFHSKTQLRSIQGGAMAFELAYDGSKYAIRTRIPRNIDVRHALVRAIKKLYGTLLKIKLAQVNNAVFIHL
jgi:hypothetical protein